MTAAAIAGTATLVGAGTPETAHAQRAAENALTSADDAFGTQVGQESTGIYTDQTTRGFSPTKAGNERIDGIYFDRVAQLSSRLHAYKAIRVGFSALDMPFVAPTGVVENRFHPFPTKAGNSVVINRTSYGGHILEWDFRVPLDDDHFGLTGGLADAHTRSVDGSNGRSWGVTIRPIVRAHGFEIAPYVATGKLAEVGTRPLVVVQEGYLPKVPPRRKYLGQDWAVGSHDTENWGVTAKGRLTERISLRGGLFYSKGDQYKNYTEIFQVIGNDGLSNHLLFSDPRHNVHSTSGEGLAAFEFGKGKLEHRIFGGYRMRNRYTETGGADFRNFGQVIFGQTDPEVKPAFAFSAVNAGRIRQSSWMFGYVGKLEGIGHLNLGLQKARYRASSINGGTGLRDLSRANPWLYNATLMVELSRSLGIYVASQRGLEDSGLAPENAANRNEQLPATKTTQYEGGIRWNFGPGQMVVSAFQISKPYFTFDAANRFVELGTRRHRGIEGSLTGSFGERLDIVAGTLVLDPVVTGEGRDLGLVGKRPAGTPTLFAKFDANYRTDILDGLVLTGALLYTGKRAVTARPIERLGDRQLSLPGWLSVDLGLRHRFRLGYMDVSVRAVVQNVLDKKQWHVVASDVLYPEDRRRLFGVVAVDF